MSSRLFCKAVAYNIRHCVKSRSHSAYVFLISPTIYFEPTYEILVLWHHPVTMAQASLRKRANLPEPSLLTNINYARCSWRWRPKLRPLASIYVHINWRLFWFDSLRSTHFKNLILNAVDNKIIFEFVHIWNKHIFCFCLFWCFTSRPSQQFFSHVGTISCLPGLNPADKLSCLMTQHGSSTGGVCSTSGV